MVGAGKLGTQLAKALCVRDNDVSVMDQNQQALNKMTTCLDVAALPLNAVEMSSLKQAGVDKLDLAIAVTNDDETNILILSLLAKQFGTASVVTKVSRSNYIPIIEKLGVDAAINPITLTAGNILRFILKGKVEALTLLFGGMAEALEITIQQDAYITQGSLQELNLPKGTIIAAVLKENEVVIPIGSSHIQPGDRIVVFLRTSDMDQLEHCFYPHKRGMRSELWNYC
ncbi:MAG: NAD-binding protein [Bacillota bacterium]|nr:NAD-binding protein [Bacillota bacterium]